jgi:hypothetical protein
MANGETGVHFLGKGRIAPIGSGVEREKREQKT